jgi:hypothetical protein
MAGIFDTLEIEAFRAGITPRTKESIKWFQGKAKAMGRAKKRSELLQERPLKLRNTHGIGNMYMYFYQPKHRETLPYYDSFPLTIVIGPAKGGFMGLNLHYLQMTLRAKFLDSLLKITNNEKFNATTKFDLSYELLQGSAKLKYFKPCLKHYLKNQVRSRYALVPAPEWEIAAFLPTADFQKQSQAYVHKQSRESFKK